MARGGLVRRFPVLAIRDFRLLLAERLLAPASVGFSVVGVSFAVLRITNSATDLSYVLAAQIALAMVLPLPAVCLASFGLGVFVEMMMVQWTVALARNIPPGKLARVSSYDVLGSVMAMPAGALIAGPLGTAIGISSAQYAAAAAIVVASALALIPRDIRTMRGGHPELPPVPVEPPAQPEAAVS